MNFQYFSWYLDKDSLERMEESITSNFSENLSKSQSFLSDFADNENTSRSNHFYKKNKIILNQIRLKFLFMKSEPDLVSEKSIV